MKEIDDNLLTEFLEGKLDEPANREIENWYDASEENRRRLEALYFVLFAGDRLRAAASVNTDQSFRSLQRRIELRRTKTRPQWRQIAARYAAILVAGVIVAGMYLYQNRPDDRICTVSAERSDCSVTLPDGSVIRLTRSSQLNYPASFDDGNRTVHLTGEAFFEVSKRNGAPFTVTTVHDAEVVVRGTKFNLKAYDDSSDVETVLVEGAVDFRAADHVMALHPGQKVSYNPTDNDLTLQTVNVEAELAARLRTFRHVDLAQIAGVIEDFYGIGVAFRSEALKNIQFTGTLDFNMPIGLYASIIEAGVFTASSMKVAEASKAIENAQRDVNISFVNELALIFDRMEIDTREVLEAASTKWNFLNFSPGLVGGHCIGVDPYYLLHKAQCLGYHPQVILSGRNVNDSMGHFVASKVVKLMSKKGICIGQSKALILGFSFKENCPDTRNTRIIDIYTELSDFGVTVDVYDPWVLRSKVEEEYGISLLPDLPDLTTYDAIVLAVGHDCFRSVDFQFVKNQKTILFDVKGILPRECAHGRL
jgi:ferric-dicitrate binding protein FerR (iron transport regulator)